MKAGDPAQAACWFDAAAEAEPGRVEYALNQAIALSASGEKSAALALLRQIERQAKHEPRYCSARAAAERGAGDSAAAERWYAACLALQPTHPRALHGAARVALERGREDAVARFDAALKANPQDADLWLGKAQALDVAGEGRCGGRDRRGARCAGARLGAGNALPRPAAAGGGGRTGGMRIMPTSPAPGRPIRTSGPTGSPCSRATTATPKRPRSQQRPGARFRTKHGSRCSRRFMPGRRAIPSELRPSSRRSISIRPDRHTQEARHALRLGDPAHADIATERALALVPGDIAVWAMRGLAWRLLDDARLDWLLPEPVIAFLPLEDASALDAARPLLNRLHDASPLPLGQSLRGGTQTRGLLFSRAEPELAALRRAIDATVEQYRTAPPPRPTPRIRCCAIAIRAGGSPARGRFG